MCNTSSWERSAGYHLWLGRGERAHRRVMVFLSWCSQRILKVEPDSHGLLVLLRSWGKWDILFDPFFEAVLTSGCPGPNEWSVLTSPESQRIRCVTAAVFLSFVILHSLLMWQLDLVIALCAPDTTFTPLMVRSSLRWHGGFPAAKCLPSDLEFCGD